MMKTVRSSRAETRSARYVDASYDLLKDFVFKRASAPAGPEGPQAASATQAAFYRLEIEDENGKPILSAMLKSSV